MKTPLILASASPRRSEILRLADIPFEVVVSSADESHPSGIVPEEIPAAIARKKAQIVAELHANRTILAADTVVILDGSIYEKPTDEASACRMLATLSGKTHAVVTGVCIYHDENFHVFSERSEVSFRELTEKEIKYYVSRYKPMDKAGSYAVQEWIGAVGIHSIKGDYFNIVGLPVQRVYLELKKLGIL